MAMEAAPAGGRVAAATRLHVSLDPAFAGRLPLPLVSVTLDAGPTVLAFAEGELVPGTLVTMRQASDAAGREVMIAAAAPGSRD